VAKDRQPTSIRVPGSSRFLRAADRCRRPGDHLIADALPGPASEMPDDARPSPVRNLTGPVRTVVHFAVEGTSASFPGQARRMRTVRACLLPSADRSLRPLLDVLGGRQMQIRAGFTLH